MTRLKSLFDGMVFGAVVVAVGAIGNAVLRAFGV